MARRACPKVAGGGAERNPRIGVHSEHAPAGAVEFTNLPDDTLAVTERLPDMRRKELWLQQEGIVPLVSSSTKSFMRLEVTQP